MRLEKLSEDNACAYIDYFKKALAEEPEMMTTDCVDENGLIERIRSQQCVSLLAIEAGAVVGRIEYHFYTCLQEGYKMAYVNWVYVQRNFRHRGIAQALFKAFETDCKANGVDEYFLLQARNQGAQRFYGAFDGAETTEERVLRKTLHE